MPQFEALGVSGESAEVPGEVAAVHSAHSGQGSAPVRKGRLGPLVYLLVIVTLGVGGYWLWGHPELVGLDDWSSVQAAFSGDEATPEAPADEAPTDEAVEDEAPAAPQEAAE